MENWSFLAYEGRFKIIKCTTRQCGVEVLPPETFFPIQVLYLQFWLLDKQLYVFCPQNQIYRRIYPFLVQAGSHKILLEVSIILIRETCNANLLLIISFQPFQEEGTTIKQAYLYSCFIYNPFRLVL